MPDVGALAATTFRDFVVDGVSSSGPNDPSKADVRALFVDVQNALTNLQSLVSTDSSNYTAINAALSAYETATNAAIAALQAGQTSNSVTFGTWAQLNAHAGTSAGQSGQVLNDAGTHTDPVVGGTVANQGLYTWSTSPAGWQWQKPSTVDTLTTALTQLQTYVGKATLDAAFDAFRPEVSKARPNRRYNWTDPTEHPVPGAGQTSILNDSLVTYLFPISGQSNGEGAQPPDTDGPYVMPAPAVPGTVLMPQVPASVGTGPRFFDAGKQNVLPGGGLTEGLYFHNLTSMREVVDPSGLRESSAAGFGYHLRYLMDTFFPGASMPSIAAFVSARGSYGVEFLREGSKAFRYLVRGVQLCVQAEARKGRRVIVPGVNFIGFESDTADPYFSALKISQYQRQLDAAIRAVTGQSEPVLLMMSQTNYVAPGVAQDQCIVHLEQIKAARVNPFVRLVGPIYQFQMEQSTNSGSNVIHKSSLGHNGIGQMFARRWFEELFQGGAQAFVPIDTYFISSAVIRVQFFVPVQPIVLDTSGSTVVTSGMATNFGFDVLPPVVLPDTDAGFSASRLPISSVAVSGTNAINITLSSAPTVKEVNVAYALRRDMAGASPPASDGPVSGARGCVRDSAGNFSLVTATPHYNWANAFCMRVRTFA